VRIASIGQRASLAWLLAAAISLAAAPSHAATLRASPVMIDLAAPAAASVVQLRNEGEAPVTVQARVFQWVQKDGREQLVPTRDVVASPPMAKLAPGADYTVRVVRVGRAPVKGQLSYRLLVDEIPDASKKRSGTVSFVLRQSIPVFISSPEASLPSVKWRASLKGRTLSLIATNTGDRRLKLSQLKVSTGKGKTIVSRPGLAGYVLGKSSMRWDFPLPAKAVAAGSAITIAADSEAGAFHAKTTVENR
jgi:fimbrial chaperone protein